MPRATELGSAPPTTSSLIFRQGISECPGATHASLASPRQLASWGARDEQSHSADVGARLEPRARLRPIGRPGSVDGGSRDDLAAAAGSPANTSGANKARTAPAV